jgi:hypothetical protein
VPVVTVGAGGSAFLNGGGGAGALVEAVAGFCGAAAGAGGRWGTAGAWTCGTGLGGGGSVTGTKGLPGAGFAVVARVRLLTALPTTEPAVAPVPDLSLVT